MADSISNQFIGPILPPGFCKKEESISIESEEIKNDKESQIESETDEEKIPVIGPILPNNWKLNNRENNFYGPALPPGFKSENENSDNSNRDEDDNCYGNDSEDDYDVIGPLPSEAATSASNFGVLYDIERRALKMKDHLEQKMNQVETPIEREEWMTKLPETMGRKIGIVSKSFSHKIPTSNKDEDRSGWTETPLDDQKKKEKKLHKQIPSITDTVERMKNEEISKQLEDYNKNKRPESLLEIHRRNRKRKAEEQKDKAMERRAFDRDTDLVIRHTDASQTKSILDKAKLFNSRFSHGASHFL